ncbi:MAG: hypothetical protein N5P05_003303 [Chroococcopsis gigantea SAG 12.99]|jgi:lysophospholipase L1-like esterase|nr:SGNH/GDSL hydrolase family protein [Chlorogloea purpurea SAG 13.99]MDV3001697.1 hypothetical protein [Chroococcopsis gigantea SAG 12.99]
MLKLPRRRTLYSRNSYYKPPKRAQKVSWLWIALSIPISLILIELGARIYLGFGGKVGATGRDTALEKAYRLQFLTENQKTIEGLPKGGDLVAVRSSSQGYQLLNKQKTPFWGINEQGFRDSASLPQSKPGGEIRIFLIGGSTAFGQGTKSNENTIAHKLETLLNTRVEQQRKNPEKFKPDVFPFWQPDREKLMQLPSKIKDGKYRVINAAVPGYTSGNQLSQLTRNILPYQPDLIIVLDGYGDLLLSSDRQQTEIPHIDEFLNDASKHYQASFNQSLQQWLNGIGITQAINQLTAKPDSDNPEDQILPTGGLSVRQFLPRDDKELNRRIDRYLDNQKQFLSLAKMTNVPVVLAIQPEITGRALEKLSPAERVIRKKLDDNYLDTIPTAYNKLIQSSQKLSSAFGQNVKVENLYSLSQSASKPLFTDTVNLTESGNAIVANNLYKSITNWNKLQIVPENFYLKAN